jgi:hypothetical protein
MKNANRSGPQISCLLLVLAGSACNSSSNVGIEPDGATGPGAPGGSIMSKTLFPLAVGNQWTYAVAAVGTGSICNAGSHSQRVISTNAVAGRPAFQLNSFCTALPSVNDYAAGPKADQIDFYYQGTWLTFLDPNLTQGHSWPYFNTSFYWRHETQIVVPAGIYNDCWTTVQDVAYTAYSTYCRGVGLVRSYSSDLNGNGWDAKLASFNLAN